jgi:SAM-dependent methyltransferase
MTRDRAGARLAASHGGADGRQRPGRHGSIEDGRSDPGAPERPADVSEGPPPSTGEIARQFGAQARLYAMSKLHREGAALPLLLERTQPVMDETLLDLACGPAHLALFFAPYVRRGVGLDVSPEMLGAARLLARQQERDNLGWVVGDAHRLPFADRSFDLVACRAAAHHFADVPRALGEAARVLVRGGRLGIVDGMVPEDDLLDRFINALDRLHDPTTVRNYRPSEWRAMVEAAGLRVDSVEAEIHELPEGRSLSDWIARSGGSTAVLEEARARLLEAPPAVRDYLKVRETPDDVRFDLARVVVVARRTD